MRFSLREKVSNCFHRRDNIFNSLFSLNILMVTYKVSCVKESTTDQTDYKWEAGFYCDHNFSITKGKATRQQLDLALFYLYLCTKMFVSWKVVCLRSTLLLFLFFRKLLNSHLLKCNVVAVVQCAKISRDSLSHILSFDSSVV